MSAWEDRAHHPKRKVAPASWYGGYRGYGYLAGQTGQGGMPERDREDEFDSGTNDRSGQDVVVTPSGESAEGPSGG